MLLKKSFLSLNDKEKEEIKQSLLDKTQEKKRVKIIKRQDKIKRELANLYSIAQTESKGQKVALRLSVTLFSWHSAAVLLLLLLFKGIDEIFQSGDFYFSVIVTVFYFILLIVDSVLQLFEPPESLLNLIEMREAEVEELEAEKNPMKKVDEIL